MSLAAVSAGARVSEQMPALLQEYTERLHQRCVRYLERPATWQPVLLMVSAFGAIILAIVQLARTIPFVWNLLSFVSIGGLFAGALIIVLAWRLEDKRQRQAYFERLELDMAATRLERVIRLASQLEDHAVDDLAVRIQLELRLADAEATLGLARSVLAPRSPKLPGALFKNVAKGLAGNLPMSAPTGSKDETDISLRERHS